MDFNKEHIPAFDELVLRLKETGMKEDEVTDLLMRFLEENAWEYCKDINDMWEIIEKNAKRKERLS